MALLESEMPGLSDVVSRVCEEREVSLRTRALTPSTSRRPSTSISIDGVGRPDVCVNPETGKRDECILQTVLSSTPSKRVVPKVDLVGSTGKVSSVLSTNLIHRALGSEDVRFSLRASVGMPGPGKRLRSLFAYVLAECPYGDFECNKAIAGTGNLVQLCEMCYGSTKDKYVAMKCIVDKYVGGDPFKPQGLLDSDMNVNINGINALSAMVGNLARSMQSAHIKVEHSIDENSIPESLKGEGIKFEHSINSDSIKESLKGARVDHNISFGKIKDALGNEVDLGPHQGMAVLVMFCLIVFTAYKAWKTRERSWMMLLGVLIVADMAACSAISVLNTSEQSLMSDIVEKLTAGPMKSGRWQTQADCQDAFSTGIMGYMYYKVISTLGTEITLEDFLKRTSGFPKIKQTTDFTLTYVLDIVQYGISRFCNYIKVEELRIKADPCPEATSWLKETRELIGSYERTMQLDWSLFTKVVDLRKEGNEILTKLERRKDMDRVRRYVDEAMEDLVKVLQRLQRASIVATGPRIEPVGILIAGAPGVGKTTSSHNMMLAVTAEIIEPADEARFLENHNDFIYNRITEEEYFTGYHGQTVFYYDDIGVSKDVAGVNTNAFMECIRAINSNNYLMHMADLPDKGTVVFSSKLVWATSNRCDFNHQVESLYEPGAFRRRWTSYLCAVRKEYSTPETRDRAPVDRKPDFDLVDPLDSAYPHLEWYPLDLLTGQPKAGSLSYRETIEAIVAEYERKTKFGRRLLEDNERTKREALLRRRLRRGEHPSSVFKDLEGSEWTPQANIDELISAEVDRQLSSRSEVAKGKEKEFVYPNELDPAKRFIYKYISMGWPESTVEERVQWANSINFDPKDFYNPEDKEGSKLKFDLAVAQHIHTLRDKPFKDELSERCKSRMKSWSEWFNNRDKSKLQKLKIAGAFVATIVGVLAIGKMMFRGGTETEDIESLHAQSYSQRVKPRVYVKVKPLRARKRGHVQRVKGRDYTVQAEAEEQIKALVMRAQAGMDKQTQDIIMKVATRSQYRVFSKYSSKGYGYITMLKGHIAIAPKHFMCLWREQEEKEILAGNGKFLLSFARRGAPKVLKEVALDDIVFYDPEDMGDRDIIFMKMPDYFNPGPDILKHFLRESELPKDKFQGALLLERESLNILPIMQMLYHPSFEYQVSNESVDYWSNPDAITYQFPTQAGDCGSWISVTEHTTGCRKLIGFHVAGRDRSSAGAGLSISFDELNDIVNEIVEAEGISLVVEDWIPQAGDPEPVQPIDQFNTLEIGEKLPGVTKTSIVKSPLHEMLESQFLAPALLRQKILENGDILDPWLNSRVKYNLPVKYVDVAYLHMCALSYNSKVFSVSADDYKHSKRVYTFEEAVKGIENEPCFSGISRHTSAGYPWCLEVPKGHRGKTHLFGEEGDYTFDSPACAALRKRVEMIITKASSGTRVKHVYADFLKDEKRTIEKVASGKTRLISACPIDFLICVRMYFGDFSRWYLKNNVSNGSAIGVNVYGPDWTRIVKVLSASPHKRNLIAGDFKSYDGSLSRVFQLEFLGMVEEYYRPNSDDQEILNQFKVDTLVRRVLFEDILNSKHIVERSIYEWSSSMPSGQPLTTILNTFCNNILIRYASMLSQSAKLGGKLSYPVMSVHEAALFLEKFEDNVRIVAYGDDNVISVNQPMMDVIDQKQLSAAFGKFGFSYVDESKQGVEHTFRSLGEITFLKRGFVKDPTEDLYVAPLDLTTVLETPRWTKRSEKYDEITRSNVDTALRELSLHQKKVWDKHAVKIITVSRDVIGHVPRFAEYETLRKITMSSSELVL